ncbi:MAG: glycosyltransferase [Anaerolineales bacterium]|nr:MAG: glycosyltransferase [Anaerolineales bacterium]
MTRSMRIAYIVPYIPNLIRVRSYNLLVHLAKSGIDVTLFTVSTNERDNADVAVLKTKLSNVIARKQPILRSFLNCLSVLPTRTPLQSVFSWNPHLQADFAREQKREKFDLVHVEHLRGSKYGMMVRAMFPEAPIVWDSVDCISHLFAQTSERSRSIMGKFISTLELNRTRIAEGELTCLFDHILITSPVDRELLLQLSPPGKVAASVSVLPNGVDLEYFRRNTDQPRDAETIVFSGKMSYHANVSMADHLVREIMPKVWKKYPVAKLIIVGKDPPQKVRKFAHDPRVEVTGTVKDIRPYLWKATVAVVPLVYGAGIQNKILEAMASKTPVVTTSSAFSGLCGTPGKDALVGDTAWDFSDAILRLIESLPLQQEIGKAGYAYVRKYHDWSNVSADLVSIYRNLIVEKGCQPSA